MQKPDEFELQFINLTTVRTNKNQIKFRKYSLNRNAKNYLHAVSKIK